MKFLLSAFFLLFAFPAIAQESSLNSGDTAWMLVSSALVLLMTIPGLALFYGGLVRRENVLATMMQSFAVCCLVTVLWFAAGYTLAFTEGDGFIGGTEKLFLRGVTAEALNGTIPESAFILFQMTFAIITPALIFGAVADRMHFTGMFFFTALWSLLVYVPVAHWVWGPGGFLGGVGRSDYAGFLGFGTMIDFAGGAVVHVNAGVAGLVAALMLGKRRGYGVHPFPPHNLVLTLIGASLLWVGWFGFNAGSALKADTHASMAMLVTQVATGTAALAWMSAEWIRHGKPSVLGILSGAVAGLVAITPTSGFVTPTSAFFIGGIAGFVCYGSATSLKNKLKYDDSLDVFGIHGIGGLVGAILTGVFADPAIGGVTGWLAGNFQQVVAQSVGSLIVIGYSAFMTFAILTVIRRFVPIRVDTEVEHGGLDLALHGERVQ